MADTRLTYLLTSYFGGTATEEERIELMTLIALPENEATIRSVMDNAWDGFGERFGERFGKGEKPVFTEIRSRHMLSNILPASRTRDGGFLRILLRAGIAAAILLLLVAGYWMMTRQAKTAGPFPGEQTAALHDALPGTQGAVLTLDNGAQILLDSAGEGLLTQQGTTRLVKRGKEGLQYDPSSSDGGTILFNTLATARGKQFRVELPDGTKVWLNAASSIRYPTRFTGNARTVNLHGEAYFEVARDVARPFMVEAGGQQIHVLGTAFNVNAYADEPVATTTLVEGSVKIAEHLLRPGQQAITSGPGHTQIVNGDTVQAVAWKNGAFSFNKADLPAVMRQLARWYNVDVEYTGAIPAGEFSGEIGRNLSLSQVLRLLTKTRIQYRIEPGNKLFILPTE